MTTRCTLVTGGAGFIGTALCRRLASRSETLVVVDNLHPQVHGSRGWPVALPETVEKLPADVTHGPNWDAILQTTLPDRIVHLAAETGTGQSMTEATRHAAVNVVGTTAMLDALQRTGHIPEQIILTSSRAVYGEGQWKSQAGVRFYPSTRTAAQLDRGRWDPLGPDGKAASPLPHDASTIEPRPTNVYAATKLAQEHVLDAWCAAMGVPLTTLRLQNVYGPGQSVGNSYTGVLTYFARQAVSGEVIEVFEGGDIVRDFVHVDDVVSALVRCLDVPLKESRTLDVGSGCPNTLLAAAQAIASAAAAPEPRVSARYRPGDVRAAFADISAAQQSLAFEPKVSFRDSIPDLLDWIRAETAQNA